MRSIALVPTLLASCSTPLYRSPEDPEALLADFTYTDASAWRTGGDLEGPYLELHAASEYTPPHRSPLNIALLEGATFGDFTLEAELQQTGREYGHRDLCLFFGYQGPGQFYYVHLASVADETAHNVFIVDGADRRNIASRTTSGVEWGDGDWHRVRLERRLPEGTIRVFFDDMSTPIMVAEDRTFLWGMVGVGSFDDVGRVRNLAVWGEPLRLEEAAPFGDRGRN